MKSVKSTILICLSFTSILIGVVQIQAQTKASQIKFTIDRECDGGACHFQIISFKYGRNSDISVGIGDASLSYYFSVSITNGKTSKAYIYHDKPNIHFVEQDESLLNIRDCYCTHLETGEKIVDEEFSKVLLDVYNLGNYIFENDTDTRNKTYSETGRFAVLTNLRNFVSSTNEVTVKPKVKPTVSEQSLPAKVRAFLDKSYSGWKLNPGDKICDSQPFVSGDFDGNNKTDYAVMFNSRRKGYIIAFLANATNYKAVVLETNSTSNIRGSFLSIARKGEEYDQIINEDFDRKTHKLKTDAPVSGGCESSAYLYIYNKGKFERAFVSD